MGSPDAPLKPRLSPREQDVLILIAEGLSSKQIAWRLGVSFKTAVTHRTSLMQKLGLHNAVLLTRYAIRAGLVKP